MGKILKNFYTRILPFLLIVVILFCAFILPANAAWYNDAAYYYTQSSLAQYLISSGLTGAGAAVGSLLGGNTILGTFLGGAAAAGVYDLASYYAAGYTDEDLYFGLRGGFGSSDYSNYSVSSNGNFICYPTGWYCDSEYLSNAFTTQVTGGFSYSGYSLKSSSSYQYVGFWSDKIYLPSGSYKLWAHLSSGRPSQYTSSPSRYYYDIYGFYDDGTKVNIASVYTSSSYAGYIDHDSKLFSTASLDYDYYRCYTYVAVSTLMEYIFYRSCYIEALAFSDSSSVSMPERVSQYTTTINNYNTTNNYIDNSETVNYYISPVIIDTGLDTDLDISSDSLLPVDLYDEDTLVFTEPVTGAQYQTTGWVYDYLSCKYTLGLNSGTFYIGSYDIDTIELTYGEDYLTITYFEDDTEIATDTYAYTMVSQSSCSLDGHTYVLDTDGSVAPSCGEAGYYLYTCSVCGAQTTKTIDATGEHSYVFSVYQEPTCTDAGIGLYTCSVCGNQYTAEIPASGHSYEYSIYQEPGCTVDGIALYTCSVCGNQYTDSVDATGHSWLATETIPTTYAIPDGTSCPNCDGETFTYDLDTITGTYEFVCSDCGTEWSVAADITYGGTTYTCSNCGESFYQTDNPNDDSSLFGAIGNFISDGIGWIVDKLRSLIENISEINDIFSEWLSLVKEKAGNYPVFLSGFFDILPDDLTTVFWFSIVAFVAVVVWKRFFM